MKRFLIFLIIIALGVGGLYIWWQINATRVINAQVRSLAQNFFVTPNNLRIESKPLQSIGLRQARVPQLVISGKNLSLRNGGRLAYAKLVLNNLEVTGPPFHFSGVGGGSYAVTATDADVTDYLHKRGISLHGLASIPLNSVSITFSHRNGATMRGQGAVSLPFLPKQKITLAANGELVSSSKGNQIDFRVKSVKLEGLSIGVKQVTDSLGVVNPVLDLSDWPLLSEITKVQTDNGKVSFHGRITGVQPSLIP